MDHYPQDNCPEVSYLWCLGPLSELDLQALGSQDFGNSEPFRLVSKNDLGVEADRVQSSRQSLVIEADRAQSSRWSSVIANWWSLDSDCMGDIPTTGGT